MVNDQRVYRGRKWWDGYRDALDARPYDPETVDPTLRNDYKDGWEDGRAVKLSRKLRGGHAV